MKYTVLVSVTVEAETAEKAKERVENELNLDLSHTVNYGIAQDVKDVEVSEELREYLKGVVEGNDYDSSGYETDLDWAWTNAEDNDCVEEYIRRELDELIALVGCEVKCVEFFE